MKRIVYGAALLLALLATGCGEGNQKTSVLPQINVNADYPEKEVCLQDVAEVSYIPLDSKDDFLFKGKLDEVSSQGIAVIGDNKVYLFHPDGKARNIIDKHGEGPEEYSLVNNVAFDWERKEVYVHVPFRNLMFVYSLDGVFKRQFTLGDDLRQFDLVNDGADHLLMFKEKPGKNEKGRVEPPCRPIVRISKEDGKMDSLSYQQTYYTSVHIKITTGDNNVLTSLIPMSALRNFNGEVYLNDIASDTIYRMKNQMLEPILIRIPSVEMNDGTGCFLEMRGVTPRHCVLRRYKEALVYDRVNRVWDFEIVDKGSECLLYDIQTGEMYSPKYINNDWPSGISYKFLSFDGCDANTAYLKLEAFDLIEALEAGELSGKLKTIAEGLKEDSNPVLMVMKFKE